MMGMTQLGSSTCKGRQGTGLSLWMQPTTSGLSCSDTGLLMQERMLRVEQQLQLETAKRVHIQEEMQAMAAHCGVALSDDA
jgi:hypothetical protein